MITEQIKKNVSVADVLDKYMGVTLPMRGTKSKNIPCPIHGGKNSNFAIDTEKNIATCFSKCNKTWNVIDLTMQIHNIDFKEALALIERDFGVNNGNNSIKRKKAPVSVVAPTNAKAKYANLYKSLSHDDYFLKRGLSKEIIEKYKLGVITDKINSLPFTDKEKHILKMYRYILPVTDSFFVARLDETKGEGNRYLNFGEAELLNKSYIGDNEKQFIFVTEGIFDALSIETLGYHAIALNSASNAAKLIQAIQSNEKKAREQQYILLADNDEAGETMADKLQDAFKKMNMTIYKAKFNENYKDINELAIDKPDEALNVIEEAIDECKNANNAFSILMDFFSNMERVDPIQINIFPKLNEVIGGLRPSLYIIGATSSLGKTTFVQEIADYVASNDEHVLFFSLEMGKKELVAKSLVRTMGEVKKTLKMKGELTYTRDLLSGNIKDHNLFSTAVGYYEKTAKNLFIHEGMFDVRVDTIRQEIEKHIRLHGKKPLVIVDYLQILQPMNDRLSEKQATDKNVTELKRITRDLSVPVIAISSFNRDSYNKEASFSSFKESGSIEYSGDVVLALELTKIKELDKDAKGNAKDAEKLNEAKGSTIRDINLKVLKNRFGKSFEEIEYNYITTNNKFIEKSSITPVKTEEKKRI